MSEKLLITVDAIEGEKASLLLRLPEEERPFAVVPLSMLPDGVTVGDILSISFQAEREMTEDVRRRVAELHEKLMRR
ncbi:hypothetical protein McpSp1_00510 [Methanocorpusculaceae archaeon Sp1]|nr:hypothetical protein [Methanocorpusculaceae archaeon Sp1]